MTDHNWNFQTAVYDALTAASPALNVYDHVPDNATFPYVAIGETATVMFDDKSGDGQEIIVTLHHWSRYRGMKELKDMMATARAALHEASLTVSGGTLVLLRHEQSQTILDPDGLTRHGIQQFSAIIQD